MREFSLIGSLIVVDNRIKREALGFYSFKEEKMGNGLCRRRVSVAGERSMLLRAIPGRSHERKTGGQGCSIIRNHIYRGRH